MYDLIIKNGRIIDGVLSPEYVSDIAIKDGKILKIAKGLTGAEREIDAAGLTVTPGFFDSHSHADENILSYPEQKEKVEQGITTVISGMCGGSVAPRPYIPASKKAPVGGYGFNTDIYRSVESFMNVAENVPQGANIAMFVGHGNLRRTVIGTENREPTKDELESMKDMLRESIKHGAIGLSLGLIYVPGCYSKTEELVELAKVAAENNALVSAHIRDEGDGLVGAAEEFIKIICKSGARGILSHHKAAGRGNHGKVKETLRRIDEANAAGADIYCDVYPYIASSTGLAARFVPMEYQAGGMVRKNLESQELRERIKAINREKDLSRGSDLSWVVISKCNGYPQYIGLTVPEAARLHGKDLYDTVFDMIQHSTQTEAIYFTMCEQDVETVLAHARSMVCTDSGVAGRSTSFHPRLVGTFPRVLGRYVRERNVTSLPEMIRKITSLPAHVYGFSNKGVIKEGYDADICIFDAEKIIDKADYNNCSARAEGLNFVIVGGKVAAENSIYNGQRNGIVATPNVKR